MIIRLRCNIPKERWEESYEETRIKLQADLEYSKKHPYRYAFREIGSDLKACVRLGVKTAVKGFRKLFTRHDNLRENLRGLLALLRSGFGLLALPLLAAGFWLSAPFWACKGPEAVLERHKHISYPEAFVGVWGGQYEKDEDCWFM